MKGKNFLSGANGTLDAKPSNRSEIAELEPTTKAMPKV
jgi:hypothetical protein